MSYYGWGQRVCVNRNSMSATPRAWATAMKLCMLWCVIAILWVHANGQSTPKPVTALLHSMWPRTPLLLEASEFIASQESSGFWTFVETTKDLYSKGLSDGDLYNVVLESGEVLLPPLMYDLFIFSLSLHTHSPTIEMYQQVALERLRVLGDVVQCAAFVDIAGQVVCSEEEVKKVLQETTAGSDQLLFTFDHRYPSVSTDSPPVAVLYAELGTAEFASLHSSLSALSRQGRLQYILRHYIKHPLNGKTRLSGYGVQLAVKNTEYKAIDDTQVKQDEDGSQVMGEADKDVEVEGFLFTTLKSLHPNVSESLDEFKSYLLQSAREMPELKVWQIQDLGLQAAQRMVSAGPDLALKVMKDTAQNFPMVSKSLSKTLVSKDLRQEVKHNHRVLGQLGVDEGDNVILLDGMVLQEDNMDVFSVYDLLLSESRLLTGLRGLGIPPGKDIQEVIRLPVHSEHKTFAVDVRNESVVFINDLEKDRVYSSWPKSLQQFLQPMYPGMLRQVRKNVFSIVFCFDPATPDGVEMVEYAKLFVDHMVPARIGVLLVSESGETAGAAMIQAFSYISQYKTPRDALKWLYQVHNLTDATEDEVKQAFESTYGPNLQQPLDEIFGSQSQHDSLRKRSLEFFHSKGFDSLPQVLVNGVQLDLEGDLETAIVNRIQMQSYQVSQAVYTRLVSDATIMYDYFLNKSNVLKRVNKHVVSSRGKQVSLSDQAPSDDYRGFSELSRSKMSATLVRDLHYFTNKEEEFTTKLVTVWVVADLATAEGRETIRNAIAYTSTQPELRVAILHNPKQRDHLLTKATLTALYSQRSKVKWKFIEALLSLDGDMVSEEDLVGLVEKLEGVKIAAFQEWLHKPIIDDIILGHVTYCGRVLGLESGTTALLSNGRLIGPLSSNETFKIADYQMLFQFETMTHASAVGKVLEDMAVEGVGADDDTAEYRSDLVMRVASLLRSEPKRRRINTPQLKGKHSLVHLPSSDPDLELQLVAFVDPLSPAAQRISPLIQTLHTATSMDVKLYLNPISKLSEVPIKSFYRYVLEAELSFEEDGSMSPGPIAMFPDLPHSPLLTLNMDVPHSWLVEVVRSPHDLDNIHLEEVEGGVHGEFELEHILVEGQCFDATTDQPTPGLEYVLGTASQPERFDTIVMANLGYFQLKASPGAWTLRLREGKSADIYTIQSHYGGDSSPEDREGILIAASSFRGSGVVVKVTKRPGMERASLLEEEGVGLEEEEAELEEKGAEPAAEGLLETISSMMGGDQQKPDVEGNLRAERATLEVAGNETINIFSIASGHLYERFLRIMMLSVLKHTSNPVKFWFLKNYLSPTFKNFIPQMASEYGFEYELVQYKWPRWLHAQTEKQRLIWGYKILFLDVLFPLNVKKIIFVDADQIVRTDLRELLEEPLDGAPYGYTPFCNDRPEMSGFRFWERGYWKNHLGNRRYHISALYVVDLMRFRRLAAGDRLRGQYQALSQDPNSLSNLDQDLPNNMIHMVPIKSLPQEWLWCETWCSNERKPDAKTIDLCNNPLTKEPKLVSAMRIVPEWSDYDREIRLLQEKVAMETVEQKHDRHEEL